jgi:toxin CcdB
MARFAVYDNPDGAGRLLDVQADILSTLRTRVVVPLLAPPDAPAPAQRLNPVFNVDGDRLIMVTQYIATVDVAALGAHLGDLSEHHTAIVAATDMLFQGF